MSARRSIINFKRIVLPATGAAVPLDFGGSFFRCTKADAHFEMSFDGSTYFEFEKGLPFKLVEGDKFEKLWFKILTGASTANTIEFYYGTAEVGDNRLNIISGEQELARIYTRLPATLSNPWTGSMAINTTKVFDGTTNPDGAPLVGAGGRKSFWITTDRDVFLRDSNQVPWAKLQAASTAGLVNQFEIADYVEVFNPAGGGTANIWVNEITWQDP